MTGGQQEHWVFLGGALHTSSTGQPESLFFFLMGNGFSCHLATELDLLDAARQHATLGTLTACFCNLSSVCVGSLWSEL